MSGQALLMERTNVGMCIMGPPYLPTEESVLALLQHRLSKLVEKQPSHFDVLVPES